MDEQAPQAVRPAAEADAQRLAELLTELGYPANAAAVTERLAYRQQDHASRVLVAEAGGRIAGCISLHAIPYLERTGAGCGSRAW